MAAWISLRGELWPDTNMDEHLLETAEFLTPDSGAVAFLALEDDGQAVGFAEATVREDYVNGCDTAAVAFLEGLYVRSAFRRSGIARGLIDAVEIWARNQGMTELASDALVDNDVAHMVHLSSGFEETERVVYFRKSLRSDPVIN